jgi:hypothetical protein
MTTDPTPPQCTCDDTGRCGYCPSIATTATREAQPYNSLAWQGHHPLNPAPANHPRSSHPNGSLT